MFAMPKAWIGIGLVSSGLLLIILGVRIIEQWLNDVKREIEKESIIDLTDEKFHKIFCITEEDLLRNRYNGSDDNAMPFRQHR